MARVTGLFDHSGSSGLVAEQRQAGRQRPITTWLGGACVHSAHACHGLFLGRGPGSQSM